MAQDLIKFASGIMVINIALAIIVAGADLGPNPNNILVGERLQGVMDESAVSAAQYTTEDGLCEQGIDTEDECIEQGCTWTNGQCVDSITRKTAGDPSIFDIFFQLLNIGAWILKAIAYAGMVVLYPLILLISIDQYAGNPVVGFLIKIILFSYNGVVAYRIYGFVTNKRGVAQE